MLCLTAQQRVLVLHSDKLNDLTHGNTFHWPYLQYSVQKVKLFFYTSVQKVILPLVFVFKTDF